MAGELKETVDVDSFTGGAQITIPLPVPPARSHFTPPLTLTFGSTNGVFGSGWDLPIASISRLVNKQRPTYVDDGRKGRPGRTGLAGNGDFSSLPSVRPDSFTSSEAGELVPSLKRSNDSARQWVDDAWAEGDFAVRRYRPRSERAFLRIERWTDRDGVTHWRTISGEGVTCVYGLSEQARVRDPADSTRVFRWLLEKCFDDRGNVQLYEYKSEDAAGVDRHRVSEAHRFAIRGNGHDAGHASATSQRYLKRIRYANTRPIDPASEALPEDNRWLFQVVLDYGEHTQDKARETAPWKVRPDPFSSYHAGFELRNYRLCRRLLVFHHFGELENQPSLAGSVDLFYAPVTKLKDREPPADLLEHPSARAGVILQKVSYRGYRNDGPNGLWKERVPPLEFSYSRAEVSQQVYQPAATHPIAAASGAGLRTLDLYGEGLPGILSESKGAWYYQANQGGGSFGRMQVVANTPASLTGTYQFSDLDGNGRPDLVQASGGVIGSYEVNSETGTWQPFQAFEQTARVGYGGGSVQATDVTGDGLGDLVVEEESGVAWCASMGRRGFFAPARHALSHDDARAPPQIKTDARNGYFFANMSGSGQDVVRVLNGEVCYWPNLGYASYGAKVVMENAPQFDYPDAYDPRRLHFVDLTGSGTSDIIYLGPRGATYWINQSGNGLSDGYTIAAFPPGSSVETATVTDLLGEGTPCLVWPSRHPGTTPLRYLRLVGKTPALLMTAINNNMGKETCLDYASSADFYLADKSCGRDWDSKLHSHVPVVQRLTSVDHVGGTRLDTRYVYHDGYFDRQEREFRGFSFVEQYDSELFDKTLYAHVESADYVAPTCTKTWFHNGASDQNAAASVWRRRDWYLQDDKTHLLPGPVVEDSKTLDENALAEAHKLLAGRVIRQEVFAVESVGAPMDSTAEGHGLAGLNHAEHPYEVAETTYRVRALQPPRHGWHGSFLAYDNETLTHRYEQVPNDPRVTHDLTLEVDQFGYPVRSCSLSYPRRDLPDAQPEQKILWASAQDQAFAYVGDRFYRHGIALEGRSYEVVGLTREADGYISWKRLRAQLATALEDSHPFNADLDPAQGSPVARLLGWEQYFYHAEGGGATRRPEAIAAPVLVHHAEEAAFNDSVITAALGARASATDLQQLKYLQRDGYWWQPAASHEYLGTDGFFLPRNSIDPFGNTETLSYDDVHYAVKTRTDPAGNVTRITTDYAALQPSRIVDPNDNVTEFLYDPLGREHATSTHGQVLDGSGRILRQGDASLTDFVVPECAPPLDDGADPIDDGVNDPRGLLQGATTCYRYDLFAWMRSSQPVAAMSVQRETHVSDLAPGEQSRLQMAVSYYDGFGREAQMKQHVEPGAAFVPDAHGTVQERPDVADRWLASGGTVYNNKGLPVKQYEPIHTGSPRYDANNAIVRHGATLRLRYDALGRQVRTDTPKGFFSQVTFSPWEIRWYDENDTLERSAYFNTRIDDANTTAADRDAVEKARQHADTPQIHVLDSLGRPYLQKESLSANETLETYTVFDIQGNALRTVDPRQHQLNQQRSSAGKVVAFESIYDMRGRALLIRSMDGGDRRQLVDVLDRPAREWTARGSRIATTYDALSRPTEVRVEEGAAGGSADVAERYTYGEDVTDQDAARRKNLVGRLVDQRDQSGRDTTLRCDLAGRPVETVRRIRTEYKTRADWSGNIDLLPETFTTARSFNAIGQVTREVLADGSVRTPTYHPSGLLNRIHLATTDEAVDEQLIGASEYNARGQRTRVRYGNGVQTSYSYDEDTFRLRRLHSQREGDAGARTLQDINYTYDPVGNLTRKDDRTREHILQNLPWQHDAQHRHCDYVYDALYRLTQASGWLHKALQQNDYTNAFKGSRHLTLNNGQALTRYTRHYRYDAAGNMTRMRQAGDVAWTRNMWVADTSNRSLPKQRPTGAERSNPESLFDAAGNLTHLDHMGGPLRWDYRDRLASAVVIDRADADRDDDAEYYVYDAGGQRVRKVEERIEHGRVVVREKLYLDGCEIKREHSGDRLVLERTTTHVDDGERRVALMHRWPVDARNAETDTPGTASLHYLFDDQLGSSSLELDRRGRVIGYEEFFPYGRSALIAGDKVQEVRRRDYRYSGKERDDVTGLYYYGFRYYAPWIARWLNPDPAGPVDGLNLYQYVVDNPINYADVLGLQKQRRIDALQLDKEATRRYRSGKLEIGYDLSPIQFPTGNGNDSIPIYESINQHGGSYLYLYQPNDPENAGVFRPVQIETIRGQDVQAQESDRDDEADAVLNRSLSDSEKADTPDGATPEDSVAREQPRNDVEDDQMPSENASHDAPDDTPKNEIDAGIVAEGVAEGAAVVGGTYLLETAFVASGILTGGLAFAIGAGFVAAVGVVAYATRSEQAKAAGVQDSEARVAGVAAMDAVGVSGLVEGESGEDFITGRTLTTRQRSERLAQGIVGAGTLAVAATLKVHEVRTSSERSPGVGVDRRVNRFGEQVTETFKEKINPDEYWASKANEGPISREQMATPEPGDPILLSHYGPGEVHLPKEGTTEFYHRSMRDQLIEKYDMASDARFNPRIEQMNPYVDAVSERGAELHARHLGGRGIVSQEARAYYGATGDASRILAEELPYLEQASHIYFFVDDDMYHPVPKDLPSRVKVPGQRIKRPITAKEWEYVMDHPRLREKATFLPVK